MDANVLKSILQKHWSQETSYYDDWTGHDPSYGQCVMTALKVNELLGGEIAKVKVDGTSHYFNLIHDEVLDLTKDQFDFPVDYEEGRIMVSRENILVNENTSRRYAIFSSGVDADLDAELPILDIEHISIRQPNYVAGTNDRPEVRIFCQTNTKSQPLNKKKVSAGQAVYMKWSGGPIVAKSKILSWHPGSFSDSNINTVRELTLGTNLYGLDEYWESVSGKHAGYYDVIRLKDEEWLDEPIYPLVRSNGSSWVYLDTLRKKIAWLSNNVEPVETVENQKSGRAMSASLRFLVLRRDNFTCRYCGRKAPDVQLHIDHVVPWSVVKEHKIENLVVACQDCNLGKSNKPLQ